VGLVLDGIAKEQMMLDDRHGFHLRATETAEAAPVPAESIQDLLATLQPEVVERAHSGMLLDLLEFDYPLAEYANLCAQVSRHAEAFQKEDKEQLALDLHKALIKEARSKKRSQSYRLVAASTLQRLGTPEYIEWFSQCIASCAALDEKIILVEMLALLGDNARSVLLSLIFQSQEEKLVSAAAVALCQQADSPSPVSAPLDNITESSLLSEGLLGKQERYSGFFGDALTKGPPETVVRIFGILLKSHPQQAVQLARYVIRHPDLRTRLRIIQALGEAQAGGAEQALIAGLDDFAWEVRIEAARTLGKLADKISLEAVPRVVLALCRTAEEPDLKARSFKVRLTALESLALHGNERALPTLEKILETKGLFFGRAREQLYGAAAAALAATPAPRAGQLLELFSTDRRRKVAKICKAALGNRQQKMGRLQQ
jgi:HEAT repeat protein